MCDSGPNTEATEKRQGLTSRLWDPRRKSGLLEVKNMEEMKPQPDAEREGEMPWLLPSSVSSASAIG